MASVMNEYNNSDKGNSDYSGRTPVPLPVGPPQIPTLPGLRVKSGLCIDRPVTNCLSRDKAYFVMKGVCFHGIVLVLSDFRQKLNVSTDFL